MGCTNIAEGSSRFRCIVRCLAISSRSLDRTLHSCKKINGYMHAWLHVCTAASCFSRQTHYVSGKSLSQEIWYLYGPIFPTRTIISGPGGKMQNSLEILVCSDQNCQEKHSVTRSDDVMIREYPSADPMCSTLFVNPPCKDPMHYSPHGF